MWDIERATAHARLTGHTDAILSAHWSTAGALLATCSKDHMVHVYDHRAAHEPVAVRVSVRLGWFFVSTSIMLTTFLLYF